MRSKLALLMAIGLLLACRKSPTDGNTSRADVQRNLEGFVEPVQAGLSEPGSPRFFTFGPVPTAQPWERPVATGSLPVLGRTIGLRTGRDGLIHERYEAQPCPSRPVSECVELLATGQFGGHGEVMCFGLHLQRQGGEVVRQEIPLRTACPYQAAPAQ